MSVTLSGVGRPFSSQLRLPLQHPSPPTSHSPPSSPSPGLQGILGLFSIHGRIRPQAPPTTCRLSPPQPHPLPSPETFPFTSELCQDLDSRGQRSGAWSLQAPHPWIAPNQPLSQAGRAGAGGRAEAWLLGRVPLNRCAEAGVWEATWEFWVTRPEPGENLPSPRVLEKAV